MNRDLRPLHDQRNVAARPATQFSIRSLFLITAIFAIVILALRELAIRYGTVAAMVAVLAFLSVFAHVAGAALGSRFRKHDPTASPYDRLSTDDSDPQRAQHQTHLQPLRATESDFAPQTELSRQQPLNLKPIYWAVGIGAGICSILASIVLTLVMWDDLAIINVLFGAFSAAIIGGLLGFWASSFYQVVRSALTDAQKDT